MNKEWEEELVILIKDSEASKNINILYLDMNNWYGCAMRQYLPINNFKWDKNIDKTEQKLIISKIIAQLDMHLK